MTQQNINKEIESASAVGDRNSSESKESSATGDNQAERQPVDEKRSSLEKYCEAHPGSSECRIYEV